MLNPFVVIPYHPIVSGQSCPACPSFALPAGSHGPPSGDPLVCHRADDGDPSLAVGLPLVLGSLSGFKTKDVVRSPWYTDLKEPAFRPPRASFGIVWPILYASVRSTPARASGLPGSCPPTSTFAFVGLTGPLRPPLSLSPAGRWATPRT